MSKIAAYIDVKMVLRRCHLPHVIVVRLHAGSIDVVILTTKMRDHLVDQQRLSFKTKAFVFHDLRHYQLDVIYRK